MLLSAMGERLVYFPQPLDAAQARAILTRHPQAREITIPTADGMRLHGWYVPGGSNTARPLVIYFGGNADQVSWMLDYSNALAGWDLALCNYRGYGLSTGTPNQQALFADALTIYDYLTQQPDIDPKRVVVMERSLGSGVATHLASQRPLRGVILITPFDSVTNIARIYYPFLPVRWLVGDLYDSAALAPKLTLPMLMILASHDEVIPAPYSHNLFALWAGPKDSVVMPQTGHNTVQERPEHWLAIQTFLQRWR